MKTICELSATIAGDPGGSTEPWMAGDRADPGVLVGHAHRLACASRDATLYPGDAPCLVGPAVVGRDERGQQLSLPGGGLLNGNLGIALLFATVFWVTGDRILRQDACRLLRPLDRGIDNLPSLIACRQPIDLGLANGVGGTIYGLAALATLLDDAECVDRAEAVLRALTPTAIATGRDCSLAAGAAGLAIALVAFSRLSGYAAEIAAPALRVCAGHLLDCQRVHWRGGACWPVPGEGDGPTGLLHGAAGIALALTEVAAFQRAEELRTEELRVAASAALEYERATVMASGGYGGRRDGAGGTPRRYADGAAGTGLALIRMLDRGVGATEATVIELASAVAAGPFDPTDDLFTGNAGRLLFLHAAAVALHDASLDGRVDRALARRLAAADAAGGFAWPAGCDGDNPCLAGGAAGLGLALLHMAEPEWVPAFAAFPTSFPGPRRRCGRQAPDMRTRLGPVLRGAGRGFEVRG